MPLAAWARIGGRLGTRARLRVSGRLCRALLSDGVIYRGVGGFGFRIDRDDPFQAAMLLGMYDPIVESLIRRYTPRGGTTIDAGAHLGYFSLRFARLVGPEGAVHSFECDPRLVPRLTQHVELNGLDWVNVNACGLLDRELDAAPFYLPEQLGWSSVLEGAWGATKAATVRMVSLDRYALDNRIEPEQLSFIKLDIEGSELSALKGARDLLQASAAPVLIEYLPERMRAMGSNPEELLELMAALGYEPWAPAVVRRGSVELAPGVVPKAGEDVLFLKRGGQQRC